MIHAEGTEFDPFGQAKMNLISSQNAVEQIGTATPALLGGGKHGWNVFAGMRSIGAISIIVPVYLPDGGRICHGRPFAFNPGSIIDAKKRGAMRPGVRQA